MHFLTSKCAAILCRKEYEKLRRECRRLLKQYDQSCSSKQFSGKVIQDAQSPSSEEVESARESLSSGERTPDDGIGVDSATVLLEGDNSSRRITSADGSTLNTESSDTDSSDDVEVIRASVHSDGR